MNTTALLAFLKSLWPTNYDQWTGILRAIVPAGIAFAISHHWIPDVSGSVGVVTVAVVAVGAAIWSILNNVSGKTIP